MNRRDTQQVFARICGSWHRFFDWWMPIAEKIGHFMNRVILCLFYFSIVLPFGVGVRLFSDPLRLRNKLDSGWTNCSRCKNTIEDARKHF